ncbi:MAG TPA: hypothetical protein DCP91_10030 [Eggerthellaceae bacterium]|nr:hypothetical protein [Eggerthellaceae bacterium]
MAQITYVFCHGLNGSGQYDKRYEKKPYWGRASGDVVAALRAQGYSAFAASVAPQGSAWDRACELYAQIAGTTTDYGAAHSREYRHERFGRDFSGQPLVPEWDDDTRLVLIGHSFGGTTIRLFSELLAHGSPEERAATPADELSPFFRGGMAQRVRAIVTLASPNNGTTAYELARDKSFKKPSVKVSIKSRLLDRFMKAVVRIKTDGRDARDWANFDMMLDNAQALNGRISTIPQVYYLSVACDATMQGPGGTCIPSESLIDPLLMRSSTYMGCYNCKTDAGVVADDEWHANDGLVNTVSARAPFGVPHKPLDRDNMEKGVWNVMPDLRVDHGYFMGGYLKKQNPHPFFQDLMNLLENLD